MRPDDLCTTPECGHPRVGNGPSEGHFVGHRNARASGGGPCKVPQCACRGFRAAPKGDAAARTGAYEAPVERIGISRWSADDEK